MKRILVLILLLIVRTAVAAGCTKPTVCENIDWSFLGGEDQVLAGKILSSANAISAKISPDILAPDNEKGDIHRWVKQRVEESVKGNASVVRVPILANFGWGCTPPSDYCLNFSGGGCVSVFFAGNEAQINDYHDKCESNGPYDKRRNEYCYAKWNAEGYFTGKIKKICTDPEREGSEGCCTERSDMYEFHVLRVKNAGDTKSDFLFKTMLPGASQAPKGDVIKDGPPFGVYVANLFMSDAKSLKKSENLTVKLISMGYSNTKQVDSRLIPAMWCCFDVVLIDRFEDEAAAKSLVKELKKKGISDVISGRLF